MSEKMPSFGDVSENPHKFMLETEIKQSDQREEHYEDIDNSLNFERRRNENIISEFSTAINRAFEKTISWDYSNNHFGIVSPEIVEKYKKEIERNDKLKLKLMEIKKIWEQE